MTWRALSALIRGVGPGIDAAGAAFGLDETTTTWTVAARLLRDRRCWVTKTRKAA